jgi:hypothetical protein
MGSEQVCKKDQGRCTHEVSAGVSVKRSTGADEPVCVCRGRQAASLSLIAEKGHMVTPDPELQLPPSHCTPE